MNNYVLYNLRAFNLGKLEKIFLALFLLSIPVQKRLTIITPQTYTNGQFNEYATFFIYLSDIFLVTTFLLYFVNRLTKYSIFSIKSAVFSTFPHFIPILFLIGFFLWSFLTIGWTEYPNIAFYQSLKLAELILLALYIGNHLSWFGLNKAFTLLFITGVFQAIIGITQYLSQKSLGLTILGESVLAPNMDNVAKIVLNGKRIIRAYGTFPHPNVFAGFLILSAFCGFWLLLSAKTKETSQNVSRLPAVAITILNFLALLKEKKAIVSRETIYDEAKEGKTFLITMLTIGLVAQLSALILTFSRIAWLTALLLVIVLGIVYLKQKESYGFHPPAFLLKLFHVKQLANYALNKPNKSMGKEISAGGRETILILISVLLIIVLLWPQVNSRTVDTGNDYRQSIDYRVLYNDIAIKIIKDQPLTGIGNGGFTLEMKDYSPVPLEWWQYQPAHNIYLLITSELGIIGLVLFLLFVFFVLKMAYLSHKSYGFHPPAFLLKLFHVKQLANYALNKPNKSMGKEISAGRRETFFNEARASEANLLNRLTFAIFIGFLFIGLFDHYFWTLQQGRLIFWLVVGILLALNGSDELKKAA